FLAQDQNIKWVVVFGISLRDKAVVGGIKDGGVDDAIDFEQAGGFVELVFQVGDEWNFDNGLEVPGDFLAGRNVVPGMHHVCGLAVKSVNKDYRASEHRNDWNGRCIAPSECYW